MFVYKFYECFLPFFLEYLRSKATYYKTPSYLCLVMDSFCFRSSIIRVVLDFFGSIDHKKECFFCIKFYSYSKFVFIQIIAEEFLYGFWRELFFNSIFTHIKNAHVSARSFVDTRIKFIMESFIWYV